MTTSTSACDRSRLETKTRSTAPSSSDVVETLDDASIADLPRTKISQMNRDELLRVLRAARLPLLNTAIDAQLEFGDRQTLERLVYLARRCCQNRNNCLSIATIR